MSDDGLLDISGPLPWGRTSIRASAGTGKTWTLAALATRYLAESGVPMGGLLVVTFTRASAAELRQRIRQRLAETIAFFAADSETATEAASADPLLAFFHAGDPEQKEMWSAALRLALADFDAAAIGTIHGFAQQVLHSLGSASYEASSAELDENTFALVDDVTADVLVGRADLSHLPKFDDVRSASLFVLNNPDVEMAPAADDPVSDIVPIAAHRMAVMVRQVVDEVERRRRLANTIGYTGLLTGLRDALAADRDGSILAALQQQYRVALIDEFQDTDPVQWEILSQLFPAAAGGAEPPRSLVMVGDPKQAIYSFRGANVHTYVDATAQASTATLGQNFRSDARLIQALDTFFGGAQFGQESIAFESVDAAAPDSLLRLDDAVPPALVVRTMATDNPHAPTTSRDRVAHGPAAEIIAADLADRVVTLLDSGRILPRTNPEETRSVPVRPQDIAVLITAYSQVPVLQAALNRRGVPSVVARTGNVFDSEAAQHWKWLLHGLARPADALRARMVALSWFLPSTADDLASSDPRDLTRLQAQLAAWSDILEAQGVVALRHQIWADGGLLERMLSSADGERIITDLEHIAEVLAAEVGDRPVGPVGLLTIFNELAMENPDEAGRNDAVSRRLESDDNAVQIMTVHVSKGLEFPIVMAPSMWSNRNHARITTNFQEDGRRIHDVANRHEWPTKSEAAERAAQSKSEDLGEQLRLLYVAMTRAAHQAVLWWTPGSNNQGAALTRLLFARSGSEVDAVKLLGRKNPPSPRELADIREALAPLVDAGGGTLAVEEVDGHVLNRTSTPVIETPAVPAMAAADFTRKFNRSWRRWSFTAMTAGLYERSRAAADHDDAMGENGAADEPPVDPEDLAELQEALDAADPAASTLPLALVGAGAAFGTLVHEVLEDVDFTAPDMVAELGPAIAANHGAIGAPLDAAALAEGLARVIETPLGSQFAGRSLRTLSPKDRLDEMAFDLPLATRGDQSCTVTDIGRLLVASGALPAGALQQWGEALAAGAIRADLAGFLTGSIDGVFRVDDRYVVVDYKTNLLGEPYRPLHIDDYHPDRVAEAMVHHHYPLQGLLYSVGLHRYLRSRLADYAPDRHLGGMAYLFLRGMVGESTPVVDGTPHGVFAWTPPGALVAALSDLLDGVSRDGAVVDGDAMVGS